MSFDQLRGPDQVNWSLGQVGRTVLCTYENQLNPIDIILVQNDWKFYVYEKVILDESPILPDLRVVDH